MEEGRPDESSEAEPDTLATKGDAGAKSEPAARTGPDLLTRAKQLGEAALSFAKESKVTTIGFVIGAALFLRLLAAQLAVLGHPLHVREGHHWRQSFTYSVTWNFAHFTKDIFHPRMFEEFAKSNIVAMEMPLYPYLCAPFVRLFHDSVTPMRVVSWLALLVTVGVLFFWLGEDRAAKKDAWSDRAGLLLAFAVSPGVACEFRSAQPDPMCCALVMLSALFFTRYAKREARSDLVAGGLLAVLAVLTKPVAMGTLPALVVFGTWGSGRWIRRGIVVGLVLALPVACQLLWDRHAQGILKNEMNGLIVISVQHDWKEMLSCIKNVSFIREALLHFLPNYAGSWWLVPAFAAGIYRGLADPRLRRLAVAMIVWLFFYLVELLLFGNRLHSNAYYFVLGPPPVLLLAGLGVGALVRTLDNPDRRAQLVTMRAAVITLLLPAGLYFSAPIDWRSTEFNALALEKNRAVWTNDLGLALLATAILVAFALAAIVRPRRTPWWAGATVLLLVLSSAWWPSQDALQYLRYYDGAKFRSGFDVEVAKLRAAIDRYSRRSDRVVYDPPEYVYYTYARRNAFRAEEARTPAGLDRVRARGARLWLQIEPGAGAPPPQGRLLEAGSFYKVYCIATDGCP